MLTIIGDVLWFLYLVLYSNTVFVQCLQIRQSPVSICDRCFSLNIQVVLVSIRLNKTTNYSTRLCDVLSKFAGINLKPCTMYTPVGVHSNKVGLL